MMENEKNSYLCAIASADKQELDVPDYITMIKQETVDKNTSEFVNIIEMNREEIIGIIKEEPIGFIRERSVEITSKQESPRISKENSFSSKHLLSLVSSIKTEAEIMKETDITNMTDREREVMDFKIDKIDEGTFKIKKKEFGCDPLLGNSILLKSEEINIKDEHESVSANGFHLKQVNLVVHQGDQREVEKQPKEVFECDLCDFKSIYKQSLQRHYLKKQHNLAFKCNLCEYQTGKKSDLVRHEFIHRDSVNIFSCDKCHFRTFKREILTRHLLRHKDNVKKCDECDYETHRKDRFKRHLLLHAREVTIYRCAICNYESALESSLKRHLHVMHGNSGRLQSNRPSSNSRFKCDKCDYKTDEEAYYKSHLSFHMKFGKIIFKRFNIFFPSQAS